MEWVYHNPVESLLPAVISDELQDTVGLDQMDIEFWSMWNIILTKNRTEAEDSAKQLTELQLQVSAAGNMTEN